MQFPNTHWSLLAQATLNGDAGGQQALEVLCRQYWKPVRDFIRFRGFPDADAEDLTQVFLVRLCERSVWRRAEAARGRFRSFLLGALAHFLADELDRRNTQKRGGQHEHVSLPSEDAPPLAAVPADATTRFDREWALAITEQALAALAGEWAERAEIFLTLKRFLPGAGAPLTLEDGAQQLGLNLPAMKSQVHRLRARFRELVRQQVAVTVSAPHEIEEELQHLGRVLMDRATPL